MAYEISTDSPDLIMEVQVFGDDDPTGYPVNNFTMRELRGLGRGMTPGDSEMGEDSRSVDPTGRASTQFPFIARWKEDVLRDDNGDEGKRIVSRYEPEHPDHFQRLIINLKNTDTSATCLVYYVVIKRIAYEDSLTGPLIPPPAGSRETMEDTQTPGLKPEMQDNLDTPTPSNLYEEPKSQLTEEES